MAHTDTDTQQPPRQRRRRGLQLVGSQAGSKLCLPPPLLPEFGAAGTEFADRISQLLAKESTSAWPNWIEHTRDK